MEKKEIQEWRDRLIKMFGIYHSDGQEYITCPLCGINLDELAKHMIEELDKAREEGFNDGVEKTVGIIQKELDELLLEKDDEKFWVGDILRDCGYSVESILPKNMKGYLVKLKDNK